MTYRKKYIIQNIGILIYNILIIHPMWLIDE